MLHESERPGVEDPSQHQNTEEDGPDEQQRAVNRILQVLREQCGSFLNDVNVYFALRQRTNRESSSDVCVNTKKNSEDL